MARGRVLLVDDEAEFITTLAERMQSRDIEVQVTHDGPGAIELVTREAFDLVFLDMQMPGMDGIETLQRIKEARPELEVVLLTGHATVAKSVEAMKAGARDLLEKPADLSDLLTRIDAAKTDRMVVTEKQNREEIMDILKRRGW